MSDPAVPMPTIELFVSPLGNDRWSGQLAAPNRGKTNGPFATIARAQQAVRKLRRKGDLPAPVRVALRGGVYELNEPWRLGAEDSGRPAPTDNWNNPTGSERGVTYAAFPGEKPVISGGRRITGWKTTTVHGKPAWVADLPDVKRGKWNFTQLFVNGRRAPRPGTSKKRLLRIAELLGEVVWEGDIHKTLFTGQDRFRFEGDDLRTWRNVRDIELVALHFWVESRINFQSIDPATKTAKLQRKSNMRLTDNFTKTGAPYYVENVFEMLSEPGQWYLDRPAGKLYYLPRAGERIADAEVYAPRLPQILLAQGDPAKKRWVEHIRFEGLTFSYSEWTPGDEARTATPQAACHIPGAVVLNHARHCSFEDCAITHVGSYALETAGGTTDVRLSRCTLTDLGGGGVKIWHTPALGAKVVPGGGGGIDMTVGEQCRRIAVSDCEISDGGHRYHQAVGVLIGRCTGNQILHNHIHDFDYTGVSVGWTWGYAESEAYGNLIEHNHIHHIGRGMLSDMGAIYTLGVSPGTRLRHNVIHDVVSRGYGGWGIYTDEGSSDILIENNVVYRTKSQGYNHHYGRDNLIRNNIFAFGGEAQFSRSRLEPHESFTLERNIFYFDNDGQVLGGNWAENRARVDHNLYFHASGKPLDFSGMTLKKWKKCGMDRHGIVADPLFRDPKRNDFTLKPGSPALKVGFRPFVIDAGPRRRS